jgi:hypothetical protein
MITEGGQSGYDIDLHQAYEVFRRSYEAETGASWSEEKFISRARQWTFYGDEKGFVAVRQQRSGMTKLVGIAGDPRSIIKGLTELEGAGGMLWGAVSAPLAQMAAKRGMIAPHLYWGGALMIRAVVATIPASVFGGEKPTVTKDGGLVFDYPDIGSTIKYLIGNKAYFRNLASMEQIRRIPGVTLFLRKLGL